MRDSNAACSVVRSVKYAVTVQRPLCAGNPASEFTCTVGVSRRGGGSHTADSAFDGPTGLLPTIAEKPAANRVRWSLLIVYGRANLFDWKTKSVRPNYARESRQNYGRRTKSFSEFVWGPA
jgi:hypothetical protein